MNQVSNVDVLLFESAGACDIPVAMSNLDFSLMNAARFLFLKLDFNF